jgi:P4 family phage/plasmid primase-like protien
MLGKNVHENSSDNEPIDILYNFLDDYKININDTESECTHEKHSGIEIYDDFSAKYSIPSDKNNLFMDLYAKAICSGANPKISECHRDIGPIVINLNFIQDNKTRYYTETTIKNILIIYNRLILKYFDVSNLELRSYVFERKEPMLKGKYHDTIKIIYPYVCSGTGIQFLLRNEFLKEASEYNIFSKIPFKNDKLEDIFDYENIYYKSLTMLGSSRGKMEPIMKLTNVFDIIKKKLIKSPIIDNDIKNIIKTLSCRNKKNNAHIKGDIVQLEEKMFLIVNEIKKEIKENADRITGKKMNIVNRTDDATVEDVNILVPMLSPKRATNMYQWLQIGKCLFNIDYRFLSNWITFSNVKKGFSELECKNKWIKMGNSTYGIASLHYFAKHDNPELYNKYRNEKITELYATGLEASHFQIANLLMEKYKFVYKCGSIKDKLWYEFRNHRWIKIDSAYTLRLKMSTELVEEYKTQTMIQLNATHGDKSKGSETRDVFKDVQKMGLLIKKLNDTSFKDKTIIECSNIAFDPNFLTYMDENPYLICFTNGVYDVEAEIFRDGCPDDYISFCTNKAYKPLDEKDEKIFEIRDFFNKIQPEPEMCEYLLMLMSLCIVGLISEESFYVFTGSGANGKSKLLELMKETLGDLFKPMDILLLTGKKTSSSAASPELADKKGVRMCPLDEPKSTDEINTGFMKVVTGGDLITARALFKEPIYFRPQFKPFLLCNHLPKIKSDDDGTWRRLKVLLFPSKFLMRDNMTKKDIRKGLGKNQFWADLHLHEKIPEWSQTFMGLLIQYYLKYKKTGLKHPQSVIKETMGYRKRCDVFQDFIGDYLDKTNKNTDKITIANLAAGMKTWYKSNYDDKCPSGKELRAYIEQKIGDNYNKSSDSLIGYVVKITEEEDTVSTLADMNIIDGDEE